MGLEQRPGGFCKPLSKLGLYPGKSSQRREASFLHGAVENGLEDDKRRQEYSLAVSRRVHFRKSKNPGAAAEVEGRKLI